jgi:hypothetical protein
MTTISSFSAASHQMATGVRAPCLPPKLRSLPHARERRLSEWFLEVAQALAKVVAIEEWVSLDSRSVPHRVLFIFEVLNRGEEHLHSFEIRNASERVQRDEVAAAWARWVAESHEVVRYTGPTAQSVDATMLQNRLVTDKRSV